MAGATIFLWVLYFFNPLKEPIQRIHWTRFFICSLLGIVINQLLFIKGLSLTYSIHASLLMLTTPIFISIIAAVVFKEKLTFFKLLGLILGASGATVLILGRKNSGTGMNVWVGDLLIILNAISYSYYFVLVKPLMKRYNAITVIRVLFTIGTLVALPVCWIEFSTIPWHQYHWTDAGVLIWIVFGGTFLAYLFNVYGIKHLGPAIAGSYIYSQPIFAAIIAMLVLGEMLDLYKWIAALLIFSGVYLSVKAAKK